MLVVQQGRKASVLVKFSSYVNKLEKHQSLPNFILPPLSTPRPTVGPEASCHPASRAKGFHRGEARASRCSISKPIYSALAADASFVAAIPSTQVVYFFFEETASEFEFFEKLHASRVARVCKVGQRGGGRG